ncbi:hypothetical protein PI124_g10700 [Phytophthora idaei]|nr:hypothetical protein PI126_g3627 [Phytophthora idaei]KAG3244521.1 hypothetical protein PI124_g10700 [Phytophthora idaei]
MSGSMIWKNKNKWIDLAKRADGGTPGTPRQQVRTLSGIQVERRALRVRIRATEREEEEDVELQSGRMSRVETVATVSGTVILVPPQS